MRKVFVISMIVAVFCAMAVAQEGSKVSVFGGYQYTNVGSKDLNERLNFNGWDVDVAAHVNKNFSIVSDFSGAYHTESATVPDFGTANAKVHLYNYLFGPRVSVTSGKLTPFAEALFGVTHATIGGDALGVSASISSNNFGMAIGGGVDYNVSKNFAVRVGKFDYMYSKLKFSAAGESAETTLNNFRLATGVVFKF